MYKTKASATRAYRAYLAQGGEVEAGKKAKKQ